MSAGLALAAFYGVFAIRLRANQIVAGMAINMLALGLTPFLCKILYDVTGSTPAIPLKKNFNRSALLKLGSRAALLLWIRFTAGGLRASFAGEHPEALDAAGIRVNGVRWLAVLGSGALAGIGGASLSVYLRLPFRATWTAGRGFMALAALIFGKWKPVRLPWRAFFLVLRMRPDSPSRRASLGPRNSGSIHPDFALPGDHPGAWLVSWAAPARPRPWGHHFVETENPSCSAGL